jgi:putative transposase
MRQLALGVARKRSRGRRRPNYERAGVSHLRRPELKRRFPVHVTMRMRWRVWNLRSRRCFRVIEQAFWAGASRFGFRLVHFSVQGNHIHLLVEAEDRVALGRGMKGLGVRVARKLNRVMGRRGRVLGDRYHARILRTLTEVKVVRHYLADNARRHYRVVGRDPFASAVPVIAPRTYLLRLCESHLAYILGSAAARAGTGTGGSADSARAIRGSSATARGRPAAHVPASNPSPKTPRRLD